MGGERDIHLIGGAVLNNQAGATLLIQNQDANTLIDGNGVINNYGSLTKATTFSTTISSAFNNAGIVQIDGGTLAFAGGYHQTGAAANTILNGGRISTNSPAPYPRRATHRQRNDIRQRHQFWDCFAGNDVESHRSHPDYGKLCANQQWHA